VSTARLAWRQLRFQRMLFWREPSAAFFSLLLPLLFLFLVAAVFDLDEEGLEVLVPGIAAMGILAAVFTALAYHVTFLRDQGILKRVRGMPVSPVAYFGGLVGSAVANAVIQVGLVVVLGALVYDVGWPRDVLQLVLFTALGAGAFACLGVAFANVIPNFDAAPALVNAVFLPLIFISGVFYSADSLPRVLDAIAKALPLRHVVDGLSAAMVTGAPLGDNLGAVAVITAWGAAGALLAVRFFRWE